MNLLQLERVRVLIRGQRSEDRKKKTKTKDAPRDRKEEEGGCSVEQKAWKKGPGKANRVSESESIPQFAGGSSGAGLRGVTGPGDVTRAGFP